MNLRRFWPLVLLWGAAGAWADSGVKVDFAKVTTEHRTDRDWIVLDSQASGTVAAEPKAVWAVITRYADYPKLFPRIREAQAETQGDAVLLTEKVVVNALGVENVNRFTLRVTTTTDAQNTKLVRMGWTQAWTDGTIDSLEGGWTVEDKGRPGAPLSAVTYRTRSAVPVVVAGQGAVVQWFLGGETKGVLEAVAKAALIR